MARCVATTTAGVPCKAPAMAGSERCVAHVGLNGRTTALDGELTERLATMLRAGNYIGVALRGVGVARRTYNEWMRRGRSTAAGDLLYRDFRVAIEEARAMGEVRNVTEIARAVKQDWKAAAWLLERQFPERWGKTSVRVRDVTPATEAAAVGVGDPDDPFREVDELAERRRVRG